MPTHYTQNTAKKKKKKKRTFVKRECTFESQEKYPFLIEMAGSFGFNGGFGSKTFSSARSSSSSRFSDTLAFTTCQSMAP